MGTVYRATDRVLGRQVAVKVRGPSPDGDETRAAMFQREARAAAGLNHPSIVAIFDIGEDGDVEYIVMEYVAGRTLAEVIRDEGPLPPQRAAAVAAAAADALAFAHAKGIVHRDVKPANIMIGPNGDVKVMDFGIARAVAAGNTLTRTAAVLGTAAYLSPEQAQGERADQRSDVYSLGAVLYEMLAGRPPFEGTNPIVVAAKHVREDPVPPADVRPGIPPGLQDVVLRAMAKRPRDRFGSADDMRAALEPWTTGPAAVTTEAMAPAATAAMDPTKTAVLPATRPRRRRAWVLTLVALAVLGAVLAAIALSGGSHLAPTHPGASAGHPSPSPSAPPSTLGSSPGAIMASMRQTLAQGVNAGAIDSHTADDLSHHLDDVAKSISDGKTEDVSHKLSDLQHKLSNDVDHGQIGNPYAARLGLELRALASSLSATLEGD